MTLRARIGWRNFPELACYTETALLSLVPLTRAPLALGLYIIYKEEPALAAIYHDMFEEIMAPISELAATGNIEDRWRSVNPWTAKHFPEVASGLRAAANLGFLE